ncbi:hypothetical protein D7X55_05595 [Corallococcus sp. AB049A]|uniref:Uncharacterized protein n=1 Tax=Corallococcus interemptor TaxID=2316720 RepID=A0A3A8QT56_9BACT|nr:MULTISPECIES: hypothetical protein [Corallococcus]RKH52991.1 hypothetical protein D7Y23_04910 [Corallococcus sp. AB050B]RKH71989.1 hypothetical protein D7X96_06460 [Corallococcus interemptor]RKI73343.1 hypothetical protein D7X55_05595 [Corallococcus sp. AB049A]
MLRPAVLKPFSPLTLAAVLMALGVLFFAPPAWAEKPDKPTSKPADRHYIRKVDQSSVAKDKNTVVESRVDVSRDVKEINDGKARKGNESGTVTWTLNGRTYGAHDNGTLFPIRGSGFHELNRSAFKALGVYNKFDDTPRAREILDKMGTSQSDRKDALKAYKAG